ncbi:hypothetical protein Q7P37_010323 [Cladosporium fusiforme]
METTFISIHDLAPEAHFLYSSGSVTDVLGYTPDEILNRSAWDFFSTDELPYARKFHCRCVDMEKAAVLAYCHVLSKSGERVCCECYFTIVYDVMVVCAGIYQRGEKSNGRALSAAIVRRIFSSSPKYSRFTPPSNAQFNEPRAALLLNRFTRTLTIMYATSTLEQVIGIPPDVIQGRSFYCCIAQSCLQESIKCLENAKSNDSIAYLRFWFRDPRDDPWPGTEDINENGVQLRRQDGSHPSGIDDLSVQDSAIECKDVMDIEARSSAPSYSCTLEPHLSIPAHIASGPIELEAIISCASDGLVVCFRKPIAIALGSDIRPDRWS